MNNLQAKSVYLAGAVRTPIGRFWRHARGSGLKAIILAAQEITLGRANVVLAGGAESV